MPENLKILFLSAEVEPYAKQGGLGDVGGSLPKALHHLGHDVRVVMPAFRGVEQMVRSGKSDIKVLPGQLLVPTGIGTFPAGVFQGFLPGSEVPVYFIAEWHLFDRPELYGYWDDPYRFAFYCRAALDLTLALDWRPDVVHANDWHTAPAVTWLATTGQAQDNFRGIPSLYTIHNLSHQGNSGWEIFNYLDVITHSLMEEAYGEVNFMARGIYHATLINTVSPSYAKEIMTWEGGAGLDGLLIYRKDDLHGILNGLDYDSWNPSTDHMLASTYSPDDLDSRVQNKIALQGRANLPLRENIPLIGMVSRLDWQKGLDITGYAAQRLLDGVAGEVQIVVLGRGKAEYEQMLEHLAWLFPNKMAVFLDYDPGLASLIYGGSDLFLMPSRFEPCGLGQLIAMRYGSVPVVRATGGLADTVQDGLTGFSFNDYDGGALLDALEKAIFVYNTDPEAWREIQTRGIQQDFSWERSASGYEALYRTAVSHYT